MRKIFLIAAVVAAMAIPTAAIAAVWRADNPNQNADWVALGAACPQGGTGGDTGGAWYHFVLNQVSPDYFGNQPITLEAVFADSGAGSVGPTVVLKKVIHFDIFGVGEIQSAQTNPLATGATSNLVISGSDCGKKHDDPLSHR